jgi:hypothetical protein
MLTRKHNFHPCPDSDWGVFFYPSHGDADAMRPFYKAIISAIAGFLLVSGMLYFLHVGTAFARPAPNSSEVIQNGLAYLTVQQQADGGITGFSGVSDPDTTARSVMAFVLANKPVSEVVSSDGKSMLDYLAAQAISYTHDTTGTLFPGRAGILLAAVSMAGQDASNFGGMDLVKELEASFNPDTGAYSTTAKAQYSSGAASDLSQAWAILGLSLDGKTVLEVATNYLVKTQAADGSWGAGDPDTTALAVTALLSSRNLTIQSGTIQKAIQYFHATQAPSGGWKPSWDTDPLNADSTGWIIQALITAGENVRDPSWSTGQANPIDALVGLQKPDGSIGGSYANPYSTAEAIIGLSEAPLTNFGISPAVHRAGLAVFYGDDSYYTVCISFTESSLTGLDLLQRSNLGAETATNPNQGTAVCKIGEIGNASADCFGSMPNYWSYWQMGSTGWDYAVTGADKSQVTDGAVNGWSWGTGNPPPIITFQNICEGVAFVLPTSTPTSATPTSATEPPITTETAQSSATPVPAATPSTTQGIPSSYIIYTIILLGLGVLIVFLFRSRRK